MANSAVLITCHNRKEKTLNCLKSLFDQGYRHHIYLVDDNSVDGTSVAVSSYFPTVVVIRGSGELYWNRGMHLAWNHAAKKKYDFYIWVNDDVQLFPNCLKELMQCSSSKNHKAIISGIIQSSVSEAAIYGGRNKSKVLLHPNSELQEITYLNGNVVLIPRYVFERLGNLDPLYQHDLGDVDYGLRAREKGIGVYTTRVFVATGDENNHCRVRMHGVSVRHRFQKLYSPLGANPRLNFLFRNRHYGLTNALIYYIFLHFLNLIPDWLNKLLFGSRYNNTR